MDRIESFSGDEIEVASKRELKTTVIDYMNTHLSDMELETIFLDCINNKLKKYR